MGLFDDPFRFSNAEREEATLSNPGHTRVGKDVAARSIFLLKNNNNILPLSKQLKTIAFIGPPVKAVKQNKGFWDAEVPGVDSNFIVTQWEGLENKLGGSAKLLYAKGCEIEGADRSGFAEAVDVANRQMW